MEIQGSQEYISSPFTMKALNDSNGAFAGSPASPLGFIWVSS